MDTDLSEAEVSDSSKVRQEVLISFIGILHFLLLVQDNNE